MGHAYACAIFTFGKASLLHLRAPSIYLQGIALTSWGLCQRAELSGELESGGGGGGGGGGEVIKPKKLFLIIWQ